MLKNISRSLTDLAGEEYIDAVCRASAALGLGTGQPIRPVPLFSDAALNYRLFTAALQSAAGQSVVAL